MFRWLFKKRRNRRAKDREHRLDVKLRTSVNRAAHFRAVGFGVLLFLSVAVIFLLIWRGGQWMLNGLVYDNDAFAIRQVEVQTDGVLTGEAIRGWARVHAGENLMALDLMRVKRDLEAQPPVQFVAVERVLPHTLKLIVNEREPIAQTMVSFNRPNGTTDVAIYDFDEDGYVMRPLDDRWRSAPPSASERLPILVGVPPSEPQPGRKVISPPILAALALISEFDHSPMTGMVELERIDVSLPDVLKVTTTQKAEITFSLSQFNTQLRHWRMIHDLFQQSGRAISTLDLSISNNLPVHSVAANSVPPVAPHPAKPVRPKRKHV